MSARFGGAVYGGKFERTNRGVTREFEVGCGHLEVSNVWSEAVCVSEPMDREVIEKLSINKLRAVAAREKIDTRGLRVNILERVISIKSGGPR